MIRPGTYPVVVGGIIGLPAHEGAVVTDVLGDGRVDGSGIEGAVGRRYPHLGNVTQLREHGRRKDAPGTAGQGGDLGEDAGFLTVIEGHLHIACRIDVGTEGSAVQVEVVHAAYAHRVRHLFQ